MKNPSIFGRSQKRGALIPICSRFESVTFRESEAILTPLEVCQQSEGSVSAALISVRFRTDYSRLPMNWSRNMNMLMKSR
ncbi:hypothetical protein GJU90_12860 [Brucella sp. 10RB9210]|nr:hypothetical protein BKD03_10455 [Brucella sp. 09RB8471]MRN79286.1 hypothetical protein [Brucella sp. 10RB9210]